MQIFESAPEFQSVDGICFTSVRCIHGRLRPACTVCCIALPSFPFDSEIVVCYKSVGPAICGPSL